MKEHKFNEEVEKAVQKIVVDSEYRTWVSNNEWDNEEFEACLDMLECVRSEKNASWRSNIMLPQFFSQIVTQASNDASQYFSRRDFVETYVMDNKKTPSANAAERLINRTLNQRHLHYFNKYMRGKMINYHKGEMVAEYWWEKEIEETEVDQLRTSMSTDIDENGYPLVEGSEQTPALIENTVKVRQRKIIKDRLNFDVLDPRNVFMDNSYCYTLQEKRSVITRKEVSLDDLQTQAEQNGYFNLDILKESKSHDKQTETSKATDKDHQPRPDKTPVQYFDKLNRYGKFWVVVKTRQADGYPNEIEPGFDDNGDKKDNAELIECLITFAKDNSKTVLIGFQPQRCRDSTGKPYRPLARALHYIHPTEDSGLGDGKAVRQLQIAMDDTFNISNDRTLMATLPMMKIKKHGNEDNATIRFEPEHLIELENTDDLMEVKISDNIQAANGQVAFLKSMSEQAMAQNPGTMGMLPQHSSTTATAVAGADARTNVRANYKGLTFENTFLTEQYWIIQQLTYQYGEEETIVKLLGDMATDFDPDGDYYYKPISQSIETEYAKETKTKNLLTMLSYVSNVPHPDTPKIINTIIHKVFTYMGDENEDIAALLDPRKPMQGNAGNQPDAGGGAVSNQNQIPQSQQEISAREAYA